MLSSISRKQHHDCVSCLERIRGAEVLAPCGHHYDVPCVLELFAAATRDESLFPPRCCRQNIPLTMVQPFMAASALKTYREKAAEFGTPKRVYCARPACSRFLGAQFEATPSRAAPALKCPAVGCSTKTCSGCKNEVKSSTSHSCVATDADAAVLELAETSGWARCPGCRTLIELNQGCYHMTCRCKAQFCYLCQAPWKTCACPQWDEERLFHAAQARADGHPGLVFRREPWDRNPGGLVQALMQQLREHHECTHERWQYRRGGGGCEECGNYLPHHLYRCRECRILACQRCRRNRLSRRGLSSMLHYDGERPGSHSTDNIVHDVVHMGVGLLESL
ncbi:uncharacterized protein TRAVEDRAFT_129017 [Trametes versicolor FP-101664 SS1]|uniref:uncharacterized protein n=1 Tax=Trametes versicolor (strain FP-101664) TaxID=717944 RepID=UPI0004623C73|nr:uncharacterized protein TRAVEDRAFT_129017 [Trametes versicolor FP-101664 SS1]EIW55494.1 hypothetical protein TRAVEDRAFT_129017 [Trametes versicolor FP-101664 SS1]